MSVTYKHKAVCLAKHSFQRAGVLPFTHRSRSNLTPMHVLVFTAGEYVTLNREGDKRSAFSFIRQLLTVLLQHGLDPNARFSQRTQHILLALLDLVQNARLPSDLEHVQALTRALLVHGADPDVQISSAEPVICHSQSSVFLKKASSQVGFLRHQPPLSQYSTQGGVWNHCFAFLTNNLG